jgi:ribulose-5-phosphate 4-epimerase/fuculose-1-phosphate aldolase
MTETLREQVTDAEWRARVDLAALYRLVAAYGWDDLLLAHLSLRLPDEPAYLINPYGLLFDEITASSLLKVDFSGKKLLPSDYDVSPEANVIHGVILQARRDVNCVAHVHTLAGTAVASQADGLLNISQQSMMVAASLAYHDYQGVVLDAAEGPDLVRSLGSHRHMILRNHGLLTVGATVSQTFHALYNLQRSCEMQIAAQGSATLRIGTDILQNTLRRFGNMPPPAGPDLLWAALLRRVRRTSPDFEE